MKRTYLKWLLPIFGMIAITPFTPSLDLSIAGYFYDLGGATVEHFVKNSFFDFMYDYGFLPGWFIALPAMAILLLSYLFKSCKNLRPHALFLVLTLAIGAGFITHSLLKDNWGRPRPRQVIEFGGLQPFRPYYQPNFGKQPEPSKSFPCGHCTMGFYFFTFGVLGIRFRKKWLTFAGFSVAVILGGTLGLARIAQGGHFMSDVLMSALIMWLTALLFDWLIYEEMA